MRQFSANDPLLMVVQTLCNNALLLNRHQRRWLKVAGQAGSAQMNATTDPGKALATSKLEPACAAPVLAATVATLQTWKNDAQVLPPTVLAHFRLKATVLIRCLKASRLKAKSAGTFVLILF